MIWLPSFLYMIAIFVASSLSDPIPAGLANVSDKFLHFAGYVPLGILLVRSFARARWSEVGRRAVLGAIAAGVLYGASDEFHQHFTPGREPDLLDFFVDAAAVSLGAAAVWAWSMIGRTHGFLSKPAD
jgi:VanZ family protein